jgi:hypothetical protein
LFISYRQQVVYHLTYHPQRCKRLDVETITLIDVLTCTLVLVSRLDVIPDPSAFKLPSRRYILLPFVPLADAIIFFSGLT